MPEGSVCYTMKRVPSFFVLYPTTAEPGTAPSEPSNSVHREHVNSQRDKISPLRHCSTTWEMQHQKAWPNIQTKLPYLLSFFPLLLSNPLCSNCSSLAYIVDDCCHRANSLSHRVGINLFYRGVKAFRKLNFDSFQFLGENFVKLSRRCPISSERTKVPWAGHCRGVRERGSPVYMWPWHRSGVLAFAPDPYNLQVISVP